MDFLIQRERDCDNDFGHRKGRIDSFRFATCFPGHIPKWRFQEWHLLSGMFSYLIRLQSFDDEANSSSNTFKRRTERDWGIVAPEVPAACRSERETKREGGRSYCFEEGLRWEGKRTFLSNPALLERHAE